MEKRVLIIAIAVILCLVFVMADTVNINPVYIEDVAPTPSTTTATVTPATPLATGQSVVYYLRSLNKSVLLKEPVVELSEAERVVVKEELENAQRDAVTKLKESEGAKKVYESTKINEFVWQFNDDMTAKQIFFPKVKYNGKIYGNDVYWGLKTDTKVTRSIIYVAGMTVGVYIGGQQVDCSEGKGIADSTPDFWTKRLGMYGNDRVCTKTIGGEEYVAVINWDRFPAPGKYSLTIKSPLIPDAIARCKLNTRDGKTYTVICP
jgi:hypothetical protein